MTSPVFLLSARWRERTLALPPPSVAPGVDDHGRGTPQEFALAQNYAYRLDAVGIGGIQAVITQVRKMLILR